MNFPPLSRTQTLKQVISVIFICIPNIKPSRLGNTRNNCQTFGRVIHAKRQRILWYAMIDKPISSTVLLHPDDTRFELLSSWLVPQVYRDKLCGQSFTTSGVAA
jgi:hypothetical protein